MNPTTQESETPIRWIPISYREFYGLPRTFWLREGGRIWMFDGSFDHELDEYPDIYTIRSLVEPPPADGDWSAAIEAGVPCGSISAKRVRFDETLRRSVDWASVESVLR